MVSRKEKGIDCKATNAKLNPVVNSITGYFHPINLWQYLHVPLREKNETSGIRSYQERVCPQKSQCDLPTINPSSRGILSISTLKKEPKKIPMTKSKITYKIII